MLKSHEIETLRRSHAMAPLPPSDVAALIETCARLTKEREQMATLLTALPESFGEVRAALNELHRILR